MFLYTTNEYRILMCIQCYNDVQVLIIVETIDVHLLPLVSQLEKVTLSQNHWDG